MKKIWLLGISLATTTHLFAIGWQNEFSAAGLIGNAGAGIDISSPDLVADNPAGSIYFSQQTAAFSAIAQTNNRKFTGSLSANP